MTYSLVVYYARNDLPFDKGCELELLEDYRPQGSHSGLFMGYYRGKLVESYLDFKEVEVKYAHAQ